MGRIAALSAVGSFDESMIAGEEPDLCRRLSEAGWQIRRIDTPMELIDGRQVRATVYIADENNHAFLGPASVADIAIHIGNSRGPSGSNRAYLLELARALRELEIVDEHVEELEQLLL
jgi:cation transport regulator ChaC